MRNEMLSVGVPRWLIWLGCVVATSGLILSGCSDDDNSNAEAPATAATVPKEQLRAETERLREFAYREVKALARKTCAQVSRSELVRAFAIGQSSTPNDIALGYVTDLDATPIHLQQAAYNGCLSGLEP
jgi:hypothetical protein